MTVTQCIVLVCDESDEADCQSERSDEDVGPRASPLSERPTSESESSAPRDEAPSPSQICRTAIQSPAQTGNEQLPDEEGSSHAKRSKFATDSVATPLLSTHRQPSPEFVEALQEITNRPLTPTPVPSVSNDKSDLCCHRCKRHFSCQGTLRRHISSVHDEKHSYSCSYCDKSFNRKDNLVRHETSVHRSPTHPSTSQGTRRSPPKQQRFPCPTCHRPFTRKDNMLQHMKAAHANTKAKHSCDVCDMSFVRKSHFISHSKIHKKVCRSVSYKCARCRYAFKSFQALKAHSHRDHVPESSPPASSSSSSSWSSSSDDENTSVPVQRGGGGSGQTSPSGSHPEQQLPVDPIEPIFGEDETSDLAPTYRENWSNIRSRHREGNPLLDVYNFRLTGGFQLDDLKIFLNMVHRRQSTQYKVNFALGFIMRHVETDSTQILLSITE
ncbi:zinc finger protein 691-like [Ptychodera flava]|uniref:zinc finger protein 691-like n=1 Tax=Ptychodera flava TaxID=63121 RepID=UPI00396A2FC9